MVVVVFLIDNVIGANYLYIRFELDMFFIRVNATVQQAEELMVRFNEQSVDETDGEFPLEVYFPNSSLSFIKELYGDQGLHVVNSLRTVLSRYLPTILIRLKQKQEQWNAHRSQFNDLNQHWKQSLIAKHHKSQDHTAAYLEELDSNIYSDEGKPIDTLIISSIYHECNDW